MKKQLRIGFTLVELLVVISIIGMLAGLLLPAVNAARENGRRATCISNQSQIALALITYDTNKGELPPLRGPLCTKEVTTPGQGGGADTTVVTYQFASWIGYILPQMEYNQLYLNLQSGDIVDDATKALHYEKQFIRLPAFICKSGMQPATDAGVHYVCNGGYQNGAATGWDATTLTTNFEPAKLPDTVFFDNKLVKAVASGTAPRCTLKGSIGYIGVNSGTSNTVLVSENLQAKEWGTWGEDSEGDPAADSEGEYAVGFCYPFNSHMTTAALVAAESRPSRATAGAATDYSYRAYDDTTLADNVVTPAFINVLRDGGGSQWRSARPSAFHVSSVVAAFADRSVRILNDQMNKEVFMNICQPNSGQVVNLKDL